MKKIVFNAGLLLATVLLSVSCENDIDNYDAPDGGIYGAIYDYETDEAIPMPVQGEGGVMITLNEIGTNATAPITFRAMQDGTYKNTKVFDGYYRVTVSNCPLIGISEAYVTVKGQTEFNIAGLPFSRIAIDASIASNNDVTVNYTVGKTDGSFSLTDVTVLWNYAPGVDVEMSNYAASVSKGTAATGSHTFELISDSEYLENHYKIVSNGGKIYVRVAATVDKNVNYSKVVELRIH